MNCEVGDGHWPAVMTLVRADTDLVVVANAE